MGAVMTGCSNDDDFENNGQAKNTGKVTLKTTVGQDGGTTTRALAADGTTNYTKSLTGKTYRQATATLIHGE